MTVLQEVGPALPRRIDPRAVMMPAMIGFATLALTGTSIPVARPSETNILRPSYISWQSGAESQTRASGISPTPIELVVPTTSKTTADVILELRTMTSFTWEQISKLFGVSRRTVHLWAAGGKMAARNQEQLADLVQQVNAIRSAAPGDHHMQLLALLDQHRGAHASTGSDVNRPAAIYAADA